MARTSPVRSLASLSPSPLDSQRPSVSRVDLILGIGIGVFFFLLLVLLLITQFLRKLGFRAAFRYVLDKLRWKAKVDEREAYDPALKLADLKLPSRYSYRDLAIATKGFSSKELIGSGGFGQVFKAQLPHDGSTVAVKKIFERSEHGERQYLAEIAIIGRISHRNLVQLKGWCYEKGKMLLVYEYMANGSLDKHLARSEKGLSFACRYEIVKGVAAGLFYLHEEWEKRIIHNDVKPSNVLLDADFKPRLSDFGLARLLDDSKLAKTVTLAGTLGYIAPELHDTGKANEKSDVYSFGMLLLTVASGRPPLDDTLPHEATLLDWIWQMQLESRLLDAADARLLGDYNKREMGCLLQLGLVCCYPFPDARPTMRYCNQVLLGDAPVPRLASVKPRLFFGAMHHPLQMNGNFPSRNSSSSSGRLRLTESSADPMLSRNLSCEISSIE